MKKPALFVGATFVGVAVVAVAALMGGAVAKPHAPAMRSIAYDAVIAPVPVTETDAFKSLLALDVQLDSDDEGYARIRHGFVFAVSGEQPAPLTMEVADMAAQDRAVRVVLDTPLSAPQLDFTGTKSPVAEVYASLAAR